MWRRGEGSGRPYAALAPDKTAWNAASAKLQAFRKEYKAAGPDGASAKDLLASLDELQSLLLPIASLSNDVSCRDC